MDALFLGSHLAMDFLNTTYRPQGEVVETLDDGRAFVDWLVAAGLLPQAEGTKIRRRFTADELDAVAAEARRVRAWADDWIARWSAKPEADYEAECRRLNALLARSKAHRKVVMTTHGVSLEEECPIEAPGELIALVAGQIAALVTSEDPERIHHCAGPDCSLVFLDRTKGRRRLFCSNAACGNRAKVAAYRERQRSG